MSTKRQKGIKTGNEKVRVQLWVREVKQREPELLFTSDEVLAIGVDSFPEFKKTVQKELDRMKEKKKMSSRFSLISEVVSVLKSPELERDEDGKIKIGQDGKAQAKPFEIDAQRIINRILDQVEKLIDKYGVYSKDHKTAHIDIKPSDALYLAKRMKVHFNEYPAVASYVPDAYDHFVDIKTNAENFIEKGKE